MLKISVTFDSTTLLRLASFLAAFYNAFHKLLIKLNLKF
jgi:hypothetical protein